MSDYWFGYLKEILKKLFPYSEIDVFQDYGTIKIYIKCSNFYLCEYKTSVYRKSPYKIAKECTDYFIEKLINFTVDENEYNKLVR